jgi:ABC-type multidrug transport system ATPase subunit
MTGIQAFGSHLAVDDEQSDYVVETHRLTKSFGRDRIAVDRLSLRVRRGEVYGFLGPNGAGKTTTLRMLLGLVRPTSGTASVLGQPPGHPDGLARIGSLIESPAFYPHLSGWDNLRVLARLVEAPRDRIADCLDVVELAERARDRFSTYSLGMKQRLGVAAALLKDPELLILDEPTNGLDPAGLADMRDLIRGLGSGRRTVLLSSHLLSEVQQVCDRVGVIAAGQLIADGTVDELRGQGVLLVAAEPLGDARVRAEQLLGRDRVELRDGLLAIHAGSEDAAAVNRELVFGGIAVSELRWVERSLEEAFLAMTDTTVVDAEEPPAKVAASVGRSATEEEA